MKFTTALCFFIGTAFPIMASPSSAEDEVTILLTLIESSKKNLEDQQKLLKLMLEFKKNREAFVADPTSSRLATTLVKSAMSVFEDIEKNHLAHLFSPDFLLELQFFKEVGEKQGLGKIAKKA